MEYPLEKYKGEEISISRDKTKVVETIEECVICENYPEKVSNVEKTTNVSILLKNCKDIHIGPKITYCQNPVTDASQKTINEILATSKERLKSCYKRRNAYMRSLFWDGKRSDLSIREYFVDLTLRKTDLLGKEKGESIPLEEIFSKECTNQMILITGNPGYGKTTLCSKIAYDWSIGEEYLQHFDFVIVIVLRDLRHKSLFDIVMENIFGNSETGLKADLRNTSYNFLIIMDGLNEIADKTEILNFVTEGYISISSRITILITSRSQSAEIIREDMDVRYSIHGFSQERQHDYIRLLFKLEDEKALNLIKNLEPKEIYSGLAECPLLLHMLCCLHRNESLRSIGRRTNLYIRMFTLLIKRYQRKNVHCEFLKKGKFFWGEDLLLRLANFSSHADGHIFQITSKNLKEIFPIEEEHNFILDIDILSLCCISDEDDVVTYDFMHSTFQEFLSALFINEIFRNSNYTSLFTNNILLFLLGFPGDEPFSNGLMNYCRHTVFSPALMMQAFREINCENNWKQFCSVAKVLLRVGELDDLKYVFTFFYFTRIYLCLPENREQYEKMLSELIQFHDNYNYSDQLEIYLFLNKRLMLLPLMDPTQKYQDIRQCVSFVIDLLRYAQLSKFKIHFCGLTDIGGTFTIRSRGGNFEFFAFVENPVEIPENVKDDLGISEEVASLNVMNFRNSFTLGTAVVFNNPVYINYLISAEQYEMLKPHIKTFVPLVPETYNLFYASDPATYFIDLSQF